MSILSGFAYASNVDIDIESTGCVDEECTNDHSFNASSAQIYDKNGMPVFSVQVYRDDEDYISDSESMYEYKLLKDLIYDVLEKDVMSASFENDKLVTSQAAACSNTYTKEVLIVYHFIKGPTLCERHDQTARQCHSCKAIVKEDPIYENE